MLRSKNEKRDHRMLHPRQEAAIAVYKEWVLQEWMEKSTHNVPPTWLTAPLTPWALSLPTSTKEGKALGPDQAGCPSIGGYQDSGWVGKQGEGRVG